MRDLAFPRQSKEKRTVPSCGHNHFFQRNDSIPISGEVICVLRCRTCHRVATPNHLLKCEATVHRDKESMCRSPVIDTAACRGSMMVIILIVGPSTRS